MRLLLLGMVVMLASRPVTPALQTSRAADRISAVIIATWDRDAPLAFLT